MNKFLILFLVLPLCLYSQDTSKLDKTFSKKLEHKLISRGNNFPDFRVSKDSLDFLLVALHENIPLTSFSEKTKFDRAKIDETLRFLESKNWVHLVDNKYTPTVFIATAEDGDKLYELAKPISHDITIAIEESLPQIQDLFMETDISQTDIFDNWSFLILSNVLLDSWQINNVEKDFLKQAERPVRHGKNYYFAILEKSRQNRESFGIYGNQQYSTKDSSSLGVYGNNRYVNKEDKSSNIITQKDNEIFGKMATLFLPTLLEVLEKHRDYSIDVYEELNHHSEITFDEFYIWFYHFIYTQTTDELATRKTIKIPDDGNFYYQIIH